MKRLIDTEREILYNNTAIKADREGMTCLLRLQLM